MQPLSGFPLPAALSKLIAAPELPQRQKNILHQGRPMTIEGAPQPDTSSPTCGDRHVSLYEEVFEPVLTGISKMAIEALSLKPGASVIEFRRWGRRRGAGAGTARSPCHRHRCVGPHDYPVRERAADEGLQLEALVRWMAKRPRPLPMPGSMLRYPRLGVILFPDAEAGLAELRRVIRPRGRVATYHLDRASSL